MKPIVIIQLYPRDMNLYGDWGNTLVLKKRLEWYGYPVQIVDHNVGDNTPLAAGDILVGGGGQDSGQKVVQDDLLNHAPLLSKMVAHGVPMLMICGMYQLLGREFVTVEGETIRGAGILPITTRAGDKRLIGNITLQSQEFGDIIGYENHSGYTFLDTGSVPLGKVVRGAGNNGVDGYEGIRLNNLVATYLHGPLLPKNPRIADFLIRQALARRGAELSESVIIDDAIAEEARLAAIKRPR